MLKVWGRVNSINVQKVMWCVGELGLAHERIDAGRGFGGNDEAWYLEMNPNGLVPVIDDGGFVLWESNPIVRYLEGVFDYQYINQDSNLPSADFAENILTWRIEANF